MNLSGSLFRSGCQNGGRRAGHRKLDFLRQFLKPYPAGDSLGGKSGYGVWLLSCSTAIYKILENMMWNQKRKGRVGEEKEMPKCSGGTGIIYVESNTIDDVPPPLNT